MKHLKVYGLILAGILLIGLCGCGKKEVVSEPIHIATLNGPTGMGMAKMMQEKQKDYDIALYQSPDDIVGKIVSGEVDIACVPSNLAAVLYTKTEKNIVLLATNTLGTLYIVENGNQITSLEDLKGKTLISSGKGSTPQYVLEELLIGAGIQPNEEVTIEYLGSHTDVVTKLVANAGSIAMLPQPHAMIATTKNDNVHIALDLNEAWEHQEKMVLPLGVIIANKEFVEENSKVVSDFLTEYEQSVRFVNEKVDEAAKVIEEQGILSSADLAREAIPYCHIVYKDAKESKPALEKFYTILKKINPKAIGGNLPDEDFYYHK